MAELDDMTVDQLKELARDTGVSGFSGMKKDELIAALSEVEDLEEALPPPNITPPVFTAATQQLATFEREVAMGRVKLDMAKVHEPWNVDRLRQELANSEAQFTAAGGSLDLVDDTQYR